MIFDWPASLPFRKGTPRFVAMNELGPPTLGGYDQVNALLGGRWLADPLIDIMTPRQILDLRAMLARLRGMANGVRLPLYRPWLGARCMIATNPLASASIGAQSVRVADQIFPPRFMAPGVEIGIDGHMHIITDVTPTAGSLTLSIQPGLRATITLASSINVNPTCVMRLRSSSAGWPDLDAGRTAQVTIPLREAHELLI